MNKKPNAVNTGDGETVGPAKTGKKKKKSKRVDNSIFNLQADSERTNLGDVEQTDK